MSLNPERYKFLESRTQEEEDWTAREALFNAHGYKFRPRLRKDWTPSWHTTGNNPLHSEDGQITKTHLVDAYTDDGRFVCIKEVGKNDEESRIAQMLSTKKQREDPRNHCVPIIEVIDDPENDSLSYMIMPLLRVADSPPFQYVKEIMDFVDQILEGLVFIHEKKVAHRDCVMRNLLMDADAMYPEGFHPVDNDYKRDFSDWATYSPRSAVGVRYYFADFGISVHMPKGGTVTGILGRDREPPELSSTIPQAYDPFKLDVFITGNMLKQEFCNKFTNVDFLQQLVRWMTHMDPEQRPTAEEALKKWLEIRDTISVINREWRPRPRGEDTLGAVSEDAASLLEVSMHFFRSVAERCCRR